MYVTMTDNFMSGWGKADSKINILAIEVDNEEEAEIVAENATNRPEMEDIEIIDVDDIEGYFDQNNVEISVGNKDKYSRWFQEGAF